MKNKVVREFCGTRVTVEHLPEPKRCRNKVKQSDIEAKRKLVGGILIIMSFVCMMLIEALGFVMLIPVLVFMGAGSVVASSPDDKQSDDTQKEAHR